MFEPIEDSNANAGRLGRTLKNVAVVAAGAVAAAAVVAAGTVV